RRFLNHECPFHRSGKRQARAGRVLRRRARKVNRSSQMKTFFGFSVLGALLVFSSLLLLPQPAAAQAGDNAELPLPPLAPPPGNGIPDFNGVWQMPYTPDLSRPFGSPPPFTPLGAETFKNHTGADDPTGFCQPTGPTRAFHSPFPFQIVQTAGQITFLH